MGRGKIKRIIILKSPVYSGIDVAEIYLNGVK